MALSFAVKVRLLHLVCISFVKLWRELRTRHTFDRCELKGSMSVTLKVTL